MKPSKRILKALSAILFLFLLIAASSHVITRADDTRRGKRLKLSADTRNVLNGITPPTIVADTLWQPSRDSIQVSGYDKPLRTSRETFLLTNATSRTLLGVAITVSYLDMQGRPLHERTDTLSTSIPSGDTRMLHIYTWDSQHSYYYHRGKKPHTANVTPYDVRFHVDFVTLKNE